MICLAGDKMLNGKKAMNFPAVWVLQFVSWKVELCGDAWRVQHSGILFWIRWEWLYVQSFAVLLQQIRRLFWTSAKALSDWWCWRRSERHPDMINLSFLKGVSSSTVERWLLMSLSRIDMTNSISNFSFWIWTETDEKFPWMNRTDFGL